MNLLCALAGHQYRNSVPRVFECRVYCRRCDRVFGSFDAPLPDVWRSRHAVVDRAEARSRLLRVRERPHLHDHHGATRGCAGTGALRPVRRRVGPFAPGKERVSKRRKTTTRTPKRIIHQRLRSDAHKDGTYHVMLEDQAGVCAICKRPPNGTRLDIDHCHRTLEIRGLLCRGCNMKLRRGLTADWLRAAADYLDKTGGPA